MAFRRYPNGVYSEFVGLGAISTIALSSPVFNEHFSENLFDGKANRSPEATSQYKLGGADFPPVLHILRQPRNLASRPEDENACNVGNIGYNKRQSRNLLPEREKAGSSTGIA